MVVFRPGREVLLVHRPKYDDWSFPKGKLDRGEHTTVAAVREVAEETGLRVRLGPPVTTQRYPVGRRTKSVHYWTGRVVGSDDVSGYRPNDEIDQVAWVRLDKAADLLTYPYDRATLTEAAAVRPRRRGHAVVVLRHAKARSRKTWNDADPLRPLLERGRREAGRLPPVLAAYDVTRVVSSTSVRCVQTVTPYADAAGLPVDTRAGLSEEEATGESVQRVVDELLAADQGSVLCTHRPVLPVVYDALGLLPGERADERGDQLAPAEMLVVHVHQGGVVAVERHRLG